MRFAGGFWTRVFVGALSAAGAAMLWAGSARAQGASGLPDYPREVDFLVDTPGTSSSVAAGLFNPAAWTVQRQGGLYLGWDDARGDFDRDTYAGVLSLHHLGLGARRYHFESATGSQARLTDYTMGLSFGGRAASLGVAYAWGAGDTELVPRHERITLGSIHRTRYVSIGSATTWDLESRDNLLQADLGIRPLGPRLTLFGDAVYRRGESFEDIRSGYGAEVRLHPSLAVAAKVRSTGEFGFRLDVGLGPRNVLSARPHLDDGGDRIGSTYAIEWGPQRQGLMRALGGRGRSFPELHWKGGMAYQRYEFFDERKTLLGTLRQLDRIASDAGTGGVLINLSGARIGLEMMWELREQLAGLRARGKKVIVYVDEVNIYQYMLASVADQIWMDRHGGVDILGVHLGRTYMRHALEKMGLGIDEWRFFTYKSAFEGYSRDSMSEPDREQRQALADDIYEEVARVVTESRQIPRSAWDELVNNRTVMRAEEARSVGLVDSIGDFYAAQRAAQRAARRPTPDATAARLGGIAGDPTWAAEEWGQPPRIAVLYAIGPCAMDEGIRARTLSKEIRKARGDRSVKAIVLRADSPGGDPLASDLVARELRETSKSKPVLVSQGQVAASGGYWISMDADTIVSAPLTITGSIGVIAGHIWDKELGQKIGLTYDHVKRGDHADLGQGIRLPFLDQTVPARPLTPPERERVEVLIRDLYGDFVDAVSESRHLDAKRVDEIGQGRVWSGARARGNGLVDEMGGLWHSLHLAKQAAGIGAARGVEIVEGPSRGKIDLSALRPRLFGIEARPSQLASPFSAGEREYIEQLLGARGRPLLLLEPIEIDDGAQNR